MVERTGAPGEQPLGESDPVIVVGAGQAGVQAASSLRDAGFTGPLTLIGDEGCPPYQRPPLSKAYLGGTAGADSVRLRPESYFDSQRIDLRQGDAATEIDRDAALLTLASGARLPYAHLVLATGAAPRALPVPGAELDGVLTLRTLADADLLRPRLGAPIDVVVIGAGFIGMEVAAAAATAGHRVTVVEGLERVMSRVVAPEISARVTEVHREHGSTVLLGRSVIALHGREWAVCAVELDGGERIDADLVLVGIGVAPNTGLAHRAGLAVADGIVVDERLRTADPRISAIGDCARYPSAHAGSATRLESVQNAVDQGQFLGRQLAGAASEPGYCAVPWFWTHQFDLKIQMAGLGGPEDTRIVLGDRAGGRFSVCRFAGGSLTSVESVNRPRDHMAARRILATDRRPDLEQASADGFDLKDFADR